ncbi:MAG TPA: hypothetical protein VGX22_08170, partial [Candidatus Dormibacteraeota bacterium]|nr:hypothetical protein [Candidatus Dormibacteraeota bacterium]
MSDENFRRDLKQVFDEVAGSPSSNLRHRVRSAVTATPEARGPYWIAGVAGAVIGILVVGILLIAGPLRGPVTPVGSAHNTPSPAASPVASPSQLPAFACNSQSFVAKATTPATTPPPVVFISDVRTGIHAGYDRITIQFGNGVPQDVEIGGPV